MRRTYLKLLVGLLKVEPKVYSWGVCISGALFLILLWVFKFTVLGYIFFLVEVILLCMQTVTCLYKDRRILKRMEKIHYRSLMRHEKELEEWKRNWEHYENG